MASFNHDELPTLPALRSSGMTDIIIDQSADTALVLHDSNPTGPENGYIFHVSSHVLRRESAYFSTVFRLKWADIRLEHGKHRTDYHSFPISCSFSDSMRALRIVLTAMHKTEWDEIEVETCNLENELPQNVSIDVLIEIMFIADYFQLWTCCIPGLMVQRWFEQFVDDKGDWSLPDEYGPEIMMWWCLGKHFGPLNSKGQGLQKVAELIITRNARGALDSFECPMSQADLDSLEQEREWNSFH
ncbi:hypothetical protein E8E13_010462 [Curvularia kusanoi]|uniref:BTB domain-containing protein n=1 Tax=Curvularia kusanoi TaxID=90978 RepID=A0A9P4TK84_CURKU|nr:hypothetical protein E8E13_010462 [Curvularia kusanoi]